MIKKVVLITRICSDDYDDDDDGGGGDDDGGGGDDDGYKYGWLRHLRSGRIPNSVQLCWLSEIHPHQLAWVFTH